MAVKALTDRQLAAIRKRHASDPEVIAVCDEHAAMRAELGRVAQQHKKLLGQHKKLGTALRRSRSKAGKAQHKLSEAVKKAGK